MDGAQLGRPVKRLREERRWPRWRVEREADVPAGYVSELEAGKIASPGLDQIRRLAAFGMDQDGSSRLPRRPSGDRPCYSVRA